MNNDNLSCKDFKILPPVYLNIRFETLTHLGILNKNDDPYSSETIDKLKQSIHGYINNVELPFIRIHDHEDILSVDVESPCNDGTFIKSSTKIIKRTIYASGKFASILYHTTKGLLAGEQEFVGLDQMVELFLPGQHPGDDDHYDVEILLTIDGDPTQISPLGYDLIEYIPDPIGTLGTFFFRFMPVAHVTDSNIHQQL